MREHLDEPEAPVLVDVRTDRERRDLANIPGSCTCRWPRSSPASPRSRLDPSPLDRHLLREPANRSRRILPTLAALGYDDAVSMAGGIVAWQALGYPTDSASTLDDEKLARYSRHLLIPEVGVEGSSGCSRRASS